MKKIYTKSWELVVDSGVWLLSDAARVVYVTMLALQDEDHVVRYDPYAIGHRAYKTEAEVLEALKELNAPVEGRVVPLEFDGRKIEKHADGWLILGGAKHIDVLRKEYRKDYMNKWKADERARKQHEAEMSEVLADEIPHFYDNRDD